MFFIKIIIKRSHFSINSEPQTSVHTFNGYKANFYLSTGTGSCSAVCDPGVSCPNKNDLTDDAKIDAEYFCSSFYGKNYKATSYKIGRFDESGKLSHMMHRGRGCLTGSGSGELIEGTDCSGFKCHIMESGTHRDNSKGLFNIVCSDGQGTFIRAEV